MWEKLIYTSYLLYKLYNKNFFKLYLIRYQSCISISTYSNILNCIVKFSKWWQEQKSIFEKSSGSKSSRIRIRSVLVYPSIRITQATPLDPKGSLFFYFSQIKRQLIDTKLLTDTLPLFVRQI